MDVSRTRVDRPRSELGAWEMIGCDPAPRLRAHVHGYTGYVENATRPLRRREMPSGGVVLIISFGPPIRILDTANPTAPGERSTSFVAGLDDAFTLTEHDGDQYGVQVDFTPLGAFQFFGLPMSALARRVVEFDDVFGSEAARLSERLYESASWDERFAILDATIEAQLRKHLPASPDVAWAWRRLTETGGRLPIGALTEELGCSRRHLSTRFREQVGISPKTLARILRFDRVVRRLSQDAGGRLIEIAHGAGYLSIPNSY